VPCYRPLTGYRGEGGRLTFTDRGQGLDSLTVPCGKCIGCRLDYARDWAIRCTHEAQLHGTHNEFITLTYDQDHLPEDRSLRLEHFQTFIRHLRQSNPDRTIRFFHCGEYGEQNYRPHYHALIFNYSFQDKKLLRVDKKNQTRLYSSPELSDLWRKGHASTGAVTFQSAGYVARYVTKKITGDRAKDHYWTQPDENGEVHRLKPEYTTMSRRPGLGFDWFHKYKNDLYPSDQVVIKISEKGGYRSYPVPRYYDKLLEREDPQLLEDLKQDRIIKAATKAADNTAERLAVKENIKNQNARRLIRPLEQK